MLHNKLHYLATWRASVEKKCPMCPQMDERQTLKLTKPYLHPDTVRYQILFLQLVHNGHNSVWTFYMTRNEYTKIKIVQVKVYIFNHLELRELLIWDCLLPGIPKVFMTSEDFRKNQACFTDSWPKRKVLHRRAHTKWIHKIGFWGHFLLFCVFTSDLRLLFSSSSSRFLSIFPFLFTSCRLLFPFLVSFSLSILLLVWNTNE